MDEKIIEKLEAVGAIHHFSASDEDENFEREIEVEGWEVNGKGLVVVSFENGTCGLYLFVGKHGDPIENDLAFIEQLSKQPDHENAGDQNDK